MIRQLIAYMNKDVDYLTSSLTELNKLLISLTKHLYEEEIEQEFWKQHFEILLAKYSFTSFSLIKLLEGTKTRDIDNNEFEFYDIPSIRILIRALIENYLTINYLFFSPKNNEEGEFRFYLYQMSGLASRQKFTVSEQKHTEQKNEEKQEIDKLIILIQNNNYFKNLSIKEQKDILGKKSAREFGWERMIENSDLVSETFVQMWKLFSNTAHSELIGAIQFRDCIFNPEFVNSAICVEIFLAIQLTSSLISNFEQHYPTTNKIFSSITIEFSEDIKVWTKLARERNGSLHSHLCKPG